MMRRAQARPSACGAGDDHITSHHIGVVSSLAITHQANDAALKAAALAASIQARMATLVPSGGAWR